MKAIIIIMILISSTVWAQKKSLQWKTAPGFNNGTHQSYDKLTRDREKIYDSPARDLTEDKSAIQFFRLVCDQNNNCTTQQSYFLRNRYKRLTKDSVKVGQCFIKIVKNETLFFQISKNKNQFIEAYVEIVSDKRKFKNVLYRKNYVFNDDTFNSDLEQFPCEETPSLWNKKYISSCINNNQRQKYFCGTEQFRRFRSPAKNRFR